jgi:flagellar export protein FliJ
LNQHQKSLDLAHKEFDKRRAQWSEKRIEAESLNRVVDRFRKEERSAADRREQREGDDAAMPLMLATRTDTGNA